MKRKEPEPRNEIDFALPKEEQTLPEDYNSNYESEEEDEPQSVEKFERAQFKFAQT